MSVNALTIELASPREPKPANVNGINMIACAKMIGITPAALTFNGIYWRAPPYCLLPTILFAYCTGTLRVPCTKRTAPRITANKSTISITSITKPPCADEMRPMNSSMNAPGRRAMIPIRMINDIPLPTPLSVMRSPSHMINILPAARITVI